MPSLFELNRVYFVLDQFRYAQPPYFNYFVDHGRLIRYMACPFVSNMDYANDFMLFSVYSSRYCSHKYSKVIYAISLDALDRIVEPVFDGVRHLSKFSSSV